jgi:hypothetical protein
MHGLFSDLLKQYEIRSQVIPFLKGQFEYVCESLKSVSKEGKVIIR